MSSKFDRQVFEVASFAANYSVDIVSDLERNSKFYPSVKPANNTDNRTELIKEHGAEYTFLQIDYLDSNNLTRVMASRMIASIAAGKRTELAYWPPDAPDKKLTIHEGMGQMLTHNVKKGQDKSIELSGFDRREAILPAGCFYTFLASPGSYAPLVVSRFYNPPIENWEELEIGFRPGQAYIDTPHGVEDVPLTFSNIFHEPLLSEEQ